MTVLPHRITANTSDFESENQSAILCGASKLDPIYFEEYDDSIDYFGPILTGSCFPK